MLLLYLASLVLLLHFLYTRIYSYWKSRNVPFIEPFFIFGNFYDVVVRKKHISQQIQDLYNTLKTPFFGIYIFNDPVLFIRSPEVLKRVLVQNSNTFFNRKVAQNEEVDPIATHALLTAQDQICKNLRVKLSPVFTPAKMKLMLPLLQECARDLVAFLEKRRGQTIDVREMTRRYAVDIISSCAFGVKAYSLKHEKSKIFKVATKLFDMKSFIRSFSVFSFFFAPRLVDLLRLTFLDKSSSDYLVRIFKTAILERKTKNILRNDFVDLLSSLEDKFGDIKMAAQALTFFTAGNETTSATIAFALYELALNEPIQKRLREENCEILKKHGDFTYEAIQEMKYLDMVFNETLRKYPIVSFLSRKSASKYTFKETGFTLDKNMSVIVPVAGLHFDPEFFPGPENFDPERFSDENKHKIVPFTYLPFGDGPRNCIGQKFAVLVSKMALAYALKEFRFERTEATAVPLELECGALFMIDKNGQYLRVIKI